MSTTEYTTSHFIDDLYRLKCRNCELRKQLISRIVDVASNIKERSCDIATWEFEILDVEDGRLTIDFTTQHEFVLSKDLADLVPDPSEAWECDFATLLKDTQRIERLVKPGVLEMVYLVESMGLYE